MPSNVSLENLALPFASRKQSAILWYLLSDRVFFERSRNKIKPHWFTDAIMGKVYAALLEFAAPASYNRLPSRAELMESKGFMVEEAAVRSAMRAAVESAYNESQVYGLDVLRKELTEWLHAYIYKEGIESATFHFQQQRFSEAYRIASERMKLIQETKFEDDYEYSFENLTEGLTESEARIADGCTFGLKAVDDALTPGGVSTAGGLFRRDTTCLMAPTNMGKCLKPGTLVIMYDGILRRVEDIVPGDELMGPDEKPRKVLSVTRGRGQMYEIIPKSGGESFTCNDAHILNLMCASNRKQRRTRESWNRKYRYGTTENISVTQYLLTPKWYKQNMRLWRASLDFSSQHLPIDPYILGMWLGDGSSHTAELTTADDQLATIWTKWVQECGDKVRVYNISETNRAKQYRAAPALPTSRGMCRVRLAELGVIDNKHVPHVYLTSSRAQRLELLAGVLDTDGYSDRKNRYFELSSVSPCLAQNYAYLARSLGFKVTVREVTKRSQNGTAGRYWTLTIRGQTSQIPTRLPRKRGVDASKNAAMTGFDVRDAGIGDYCGFTLEKDGLFLLGDFTVTHNTTAILNVVAANVLSNRRVLLLTHEGEPSDIRDKLLMCMLQADRPTLWAMRKTQDGRMSLAYLESALRRSLTYVPYTKAGMTVEDIIPIIRQKCEVAAAAGFPYHLLADDYPALLKTGYGKTIKMEQRACIEEVYLIFTQLASELNVHGLVAIQTNRDGSRANRNEDRLLGMEDVAECWGAMHKVTNCITLNRSPADIQKNRITYHIVKSRSSGTGRAIVARSDFNRAIAHSNAEGFGAAWYFGSKMIPGEELDEYLPVCQGKEITEANIREFDAKRQQAREAAKKEKK